MDKKQIILVRHAKSDWYSGSGSDIDRPLAERGVRDVPLMVKYLKALDFHPELLVSSSAVRAYETARLFAEGFEIKVDDIIRERDLYHASPEQIMESIHQLKEDVFRVMIFCHNPGITYFANELKGVNIDNVPTCGLLFTEANLKSWSDLALSDLVLRHFLYPKMV